MSHNIESKTMMKNVEALVLALVRKGFTREQIEMHLDSCTEIQDYYKNKQQVNIAVRSKFTGIPSDIGWKVNEDTTISSFIDSFKYHGNSKCYDTGWTNELQEFYNIEATKLECKKNGWDCKEVLDKNNNTVVVATQKTNSGW